MESKDSRFIELENKVAFQERTIEFLNQALIAQQVQLDRLSSSFKSIKEMLILEGHIRKPEDEVGPPHSSRKK
jgi:SlyX protein